MFQFLLEINYLSGMETIRDKSFTDIYSHILGEIERGSVDRKHGFHLFNFSTYDEDSGYPDSRIVVLRKLIKNSFTLRFHTDFRSRKVKHLEKNFKSFLLFYNQKSKLQIRIKCDSYLSSDEKSKKDTWDKSQEISRRCYYVPKAPSSDIEKPIFNDDLNVQDENLGYKVFSIVDAKVVQLDILELNYSGHVRVKMDVKDGNLVSSKWIMP